VSVLYERRNHVAYITINRPEVRNALDPETNREMGRVWAQFRDDPDAWVAVLTGAGDKAFCAGADLKTLIPQQSAEAHGVRRTADAGDGGEPSSFGGITGDFVTWKPIIAAINGYCLAGGLELALACDIRLASTNAQFGLAEVRWALIPGAGGTQRLPRTVPLGIAMEMILTGNSIDAQEAYRIGLVNRVLPLPDLLPAATELAETIASRGPLAVRAAKRAILEGLSLPLRDGLALERRLFAEVLQTEDAMEGPRAFAEKRQPQYRGR